MTQNQQWKRALLVGAGMLLATSGLGVLGGWWLRLLFG